MTGDCILFLPGPVTDACARCGGHRRAHADVAFAGETKRDPFAAWRALPAWTRECVMSALRESDEWHGEDIGDGVCAAAEALEALAAGRSP